MRSSFAAILVSLTATPLAGQVASRLDPCVLDGVAGEAHCGWVAVPESDAPGPRTLRLRVVYLESLGDSEGRAPVVFLAGGPGQAATRLAPLFEDPLGLRAGHDIILIDQRGTGESHPLTCDGVPLEGLDLKPETLLPPAFLGECARRLSSRADLDAYGTAEAARDVLRVLDSLDIGEANILAGSYGTRVALAAARQAPERIRAMVLQGFAPPSLLIPETAAEDVDSALAALDRNCRPGSCGPEGGTLLAQARALAARLDDGPVAVDLEGERGPMRVAVTRGMFAYALRGMLYGPLAGEVPPLIRGAEDADGFRPIVEYYLRRSAWGRGVDFPIGMYLSIICSEDVPNIDLPAARRAARQTVMGDWMLSAYAEGCAAWPVSPRSPPAGDGPILTPTLVLSGAHDPVTPPRYARAAMRLLPNGQLLVFANEGHGISAGCSRSVVRAFFLDPTVVPAPPAGCAVV